MTALVTIEAVAIVLLAVLVAGLLRSHAEILRVLHDLGGDLGLGPSPQRFAASAALPPPDVRAPGPRVRSAAVEGSGAPARAGADVVGMTPRGEQVHIGIVGAPQDTLLAFLSSGCATCARFWEGLRQPASTPQLPEGVRLVLVTRDSAEESPSALMAQVPEGVPVVMSSAAWNDYAVPGSPYFVHVRSDPGIVAGEGVASTWSEVSALLRQAIGDSDIGARFAGTSSSLRRATGPEREARADEQLMSAGILPGDPSLYPPTRQSADPGPAQG